MLGLSAGVFSGYEDGQETSSSLFGFLFGFVLPLIRRRSIAMLRDTSFIFSRQARVVNNLLLQPKMGLCFTQGF